MLEDNANALSLDSKQEENEIQKELYVTLVKKKIAQNCKKAIGVNSLNAKILTQRGKSLTILESKSFAQSDENIRFFVKKLEKGTTISINEEEFDNLKLATNSSFGEVERVFN